jgi:hypothetical protein
MFGLAAVFVAGDFCFRTCDRTVWIRIYPVFAICLAFVPAAAAAGRVP